MDGRSNNGHGSVQQQRKLKGAYAELQDSESDGELAPQSLVLRRAPGPHSLRSDTTANTSGDGPSTSAAAGVTRLERHDQVAWNGRSQGGPLSLAIVVRLVVVLRLLLFQSMQLPSGAKLWMQSLP